LGVTTKFDTIVQKIEKNLATTITTKISQHYCTTIATTLIKNNNRSRSIPDPTIIPSSKTKNSNSN